MQISLENIGMIKEANVNVSGLNVIAGNNDTGKSTVGKALFATIKATNIAKKRQYNGVKRIFATLLNQVFDGNTTFYERNGKIILKNKDLSELQLELIGENTNKNFIKKLTYRPKCDFSDATFIHTPIVFDISSFFIKIQNMKNTLQEYALMGGDRKNIVDFGFSYPITLWDLHTKLINDNRTGDNYVSSNIAKIISDIVDGKIKNKDNKFAYVKVIGQKEVSIPIANTAFGIKSFGILSLLNSNNCLSQNNLIIIDEPENHLHPQWQLRYAKLLVELARMKVNILIATHSIYMIQAIKKYSDDCSGLQKKPKFYMAEKNDKYSIISDKTDCLNDIFSALSKPLEEII